MSWASSCGRLPCPYVPTAAQHTAGWASSPHPRECCYMHQMRLGACYEVVTDVGSILATDLVNSGFVDRSRYTMLTATSTPWQRMLSISMLFSTCSMCACGLGHMHSQGCMVMVRSLPVTRSHRRQQPRSAVPTACTLSTTRTSATATTTSTIQLSASTRTTLSPHSQLTTQPHASPCHRVTMWTMMSLLSLRRCQ